MCPAVTKVSVPVIEVTVTIGGVAAVESPANRLVMLSMLAPMNALAADPPVRLVASVHCVAALPVDFVTVVLAAISCITVFNLP